MNSPIKALYILNKSSNLSACLEMLNAGDKIILIEDAVTLSSLAPQPELEAIAKQLYVLTEDLQARALKANCIYQTIDYPGFVSLTLDADKSVTVL